MDYEKKIVCLANSRKMSGRCIAGKEITLEGNYGQWIRPVSDREKGEISEEERRFKDGLEPEILDTVSIRFKTHKPYKYQTENHLIDSKVHWKKEGLVKWESLNYMRDNPKTLWNDGSSSSKGKNDRIPKEEAFTLKDSLFLIYIEYLRIELFDDGKKQVRALFDFNGGEYNLSVTDPKAESYFFRKGNDNLKHVYLCVSLGELFEGYCYKLVASIISNNLDF